MGGPAETVQHAKAAMPSSCPAAPAFMPRPAAPLTRLQPFQLLFDAQQRALSVRIGQVDAVAARAARASAHAAGVVHLWRGSEGAGSAGFHAAGSAPCNAAGGSLAQGRPRKCQRPCVPSPLPPPLAATASAHLVGGGAAGRVVLAPVGGGGGEGPLVEGVVDEHLYHGEDGLLVGTQHLGRGWVGGEGQGQSGKSWRSGQSEGRAMETAKLGAISSTLCLHPSMARCCGSKGPAPLRRTRSVSSQQRRMTPSTPATPKPSTTSRVRRKGTSSGVLRKRPWGERRGAHRGQGSRRREVGVAGRAGAGQEHASPSNAGHTCPAEQAACVPAPALALSPARMQCPGRYAPRPPCGCPAGCSAQAQRVCVCGGGKGIGSAHPPCTQPPTNNTACQQAQPHLQVAVPQPNDVPRHAVHRHAARVRQPPLKPGACGAGSGRRGGREATGHPGREPPALVAPRTLAPLHHRP